MDTLRKICLYAIYVGSGIILFSPILVDNRFFFPFITTKVFLFRIVVEIMLLAFLLLNFVSEEYRPKWNWLLVFLAGFIGVATLSSALGGNFYLSFWGDIERGEGLNLWLHGLAFFVILTSVVKTRESWAALLDFSLGSSLLLGLFGLGQVLKIESLLATSGDRVDSTLGNPAFFACYLLFHIAIALILFSFRKSVFARTYYGVVILFYVVLIFSTQTRGAVLGLGAGIIVSALALAVSNWHDARVRRWSVALAALVILGAGSIWVFRQSEFVKNSFLQRVANLSLESRTAETRFAAWGAAWDGWKEKIILGWGLENFDVVFNKNFPPIIYEDEGSQVWFDRAHNVIFDRGVTTGIVGLVLFLAFLLYPAYHFARHRLRDPETRSIAVIAVGLTAAYLVQDMFIFETAVIYMFLFFLWAFFSSQYLPRLPLRGMSGQAQHELGRFSLRRQAVLALAIVYAAGLLFILWFVNVKPLRINASATAALQMNPETDDFFGIVDRFKNVLAQPTYGSQEYRLNFIEWVDGQLGNVGELMPKVKPILAYFDEEVGKQIEEAPENAKNWLLVMRHYNYTYAADGTQKQIERLNKALELYPRLSELSPTRPQVHQEAGYSHLFLYREYITAGDSGMAENHRAAAEEMFKKTVDLNPKVIESYVNLIMLYLNSGEDKKIEEVIATMDERKVNFRVQSHLTRLVSLARSNDRLEWIGYFSAELSVLAPDDVQALINLALYHATKGDRAKAIEIANKIKEFGGQYVQQADEFIESVNQGEYEK